MRKNPHLESVMAEPLAYGLNLGNTDMRYGIYIETMYSQAKYNGGINKQESESLYDYFKKYLSASTSGSKKYLLLQYSCSKQDREQVIDEWLKAN